MQCSVTLISKIIQKHQDLPQIGSTPDSQPNQLSHLDHFVDASRWSCTDLVKFSLRHIEFSPWCPIVFEVLAELLGVSALSGSIASPNLEMREFANWITTDLCMEQMPQQIQGI